MSQQTLVVQIPPGERAALKERLASGVFEFRSVPHATFSVKGEGIVATLYQSGKFVVQGSDPAFFVERYGLERYGAGNPAAKAVPKMKASAAPELATRTTVGSDETGKGDYFGPLVICAARVPVEQAQSLLSAGVTDSKRLSDGKAMLLGARLRQEVEHSLQVLMPPEYQAEWKKLGLHGLMSKQHAAAIRKVARRGDRVVIDQFSKQDEIGPRLKDLRLEIELRPRAESELAVAAASIIARSEFLVSLRELGEEHDVELPKGAGPMVDQVGAAIVRAHGFHHLERLAKVHFKNTEKIREILGMR